MTFNDKVINNLHNIVRKEKCIAFKTEFYELLAIVGKSFLDTDGELIADKLKETTDDNRDFVRNRYYKRQEGLILNIKPGNVQYIVFVYDGLITKDFVENN